MQLSPHWSYNLINDPKRFGFVLARYKFASDLFKSKYSWSVLELGCSEGIGLTQLGGADSYLGIDLDLEAIEAANKNFVNPNWEFKHDDFLGKEYGKFDCIVSLDVIEHISKDVENSFFDTIKMNLKEDGIAVVGTPNITSERFASQASKLGHINLFDNDRLKSSMERIFHNVFTFGLNDEIVHVSYENMRHYIMAVGVNLK